MSLTSDTAAPSAARRPAAESSPRGGASAPVETEGAGVVARLMALRRRNEGDAAHYQNSFRTLARHFDAIYGTLDVRVGVTTIQDRVKSGDVRGEQLAALVDGMAIDTASDNRPRCQTLRSSSGEWLAVLSSPVYDADTAQLIGAVVLAMTTPDEATGEARLRELGMLLMLAAANKPSASPQAGSADKRILVLQKSLERAARCGSLVELAFNLVNGLGERLGCTQVGMGVVRGNEIRVDAISGLDHVVAKSPGVTKMRQAMAECLDARRPLLVQQSSDESPAADGGRMLHRQWRQAVHGDAIFSVPLLVEGQVVAVVSLRRAAGAEFGEADVQSIPKMLEPYAPAVALFLATDRSLLEHLRHSAQQTFFPSLRHKPAQRWAAAAAILAAIGFVAFGAWEHRVATPCVVAPAQKHHLSAPFAGAIGQVLVRSGDAVKAGQILLRLDTRELELERQRLEAEIASSRIDVDRALSVKDGAAALVAKSRHDALSVQWSVVRRRLERAAITAPVDGVVMGGDPRERHGQTVELGETLLELAADAGRFVELRAPEHAVVHLREGQVGAYVSAARPNLSLPCTVRRVRPSAESIDGQNVFVVEAELVECPDWVRVGMEGHARIDAGRRPVWWLLFHGPIDALRRELWL